MEGLHYGSLVGIAVAMAIAAGIPAFFPRLVVPAVVLEIVMGVILGPQVLHVFKGGPIANLLYTLGLAMLFLIAGYEVNPAILRGHPIVKAALGWVVSVAIAFAAAFVLVRSGGAIAVCLTALALSTTTLGALMPILRDENLLSPPYGPFVLAAGAIGEVGPIVALTFALAGHESTIARAATLIVFAAAATAAIVTLSFAHSKAFERVVARSIATSGQFPVRLASAILIVLVALTAQLNMDVVLGAFVAGMLLRALIPAEHHESVAVRLDGLGFAFLVPMFFIISGSRLDVAGLMSSWSSLAMVPIYALVMLVARGIPALLLYRSDLTRPQRFGLAFHSGTQLSLVVAITAIAAQRGVMSGAQAAAMVGGGILTLLLYPAIAAVFLKARLAAPGGTGLTSS